MLTILIIICLGTSFYAGYRRGLMLQIVYGVGYVLSFVVAQKKYRALGEKLELLNILVLNKEIPLFLILNT